MDIVLIQSIVPRKKAFEHEINRKDSKRMDGLFKRLLRLWEKRRNKKRHQKRISNLIANSNCIGTTAMLFSQQPRATTGDLMQTKKPVGIRTLTKIKNNYRSIITQMECIGTEVSGNTATYGFDGADYDSPRDFVIAQAFICNNLKTFMERLGYYPEARFRHRTPFEMLSDFAEDWDDPYCENWYFLASEYFDGRELK